MQTKAETLPRLTLFYGWWIVIAGFILVIYGTGVHDYARNQLPYFVRSLDRSVSQVATAVSVLSIAGTISLLAIGPLIDRFGPRRLMLIGIPLVAIGFIGLSFINDS